MHHGASPGELSTTASVWVALGLTAALAALHLLAPRLHGVPRLSERATASLAGGIAVAYVFLHLLPELALGNEVVGEVLRDALDPTPLLELVIFAVALGGFAAFYGLEHLARRHAPAGGPPVGVFRLHLGAFAVYNAVITYTMPLRLRTGVDFALLFTVAMGLHFVLTDRGLAANHPRRFDHRGRFVLAAGLLAGWLAALVAAPASTLLVALLSAALGGAILLNVFKEELPSERESSFGWFAAGAVGYGALLAVVTALSE